MPRWLIAIVLMSGCAFSLSGPAPNRPHHEIPKCDTSKGLVVLDSVMATAAGLVALTVVAEDGGAAALLPLAVGALYLGGAIHGSRAVDQCRAQMGLFEAGLAAQHTLPPPETDEPPRPRSAAVDERPPLRVPVVQAPPSPQPQRPPLSQQQPPKQTQPKQPAPVASDDWSDFWREVP